MLDNTAKISEIITALENMQGLNQKADLKNALIAKGINALDTDGVANLIAKLNSANLVLNGKRFAYGELSVTINTDRIMSITGLSFTPSKVIVSCYEYSNSPYTDSLNLIISNIADIYNMYGSFTDNSGDEITSHGEKIKSKIITGGFNVYLPKIGNGGNLKYWAYE
ncbi:hypothetical protein NE169_15340 [Clostridium botulinum]|uniref:hypothetical protein n=1 Tax=Clostridium botulinum TaxID=1491 RepID=UPI0021482C03|nr:hypothetical protein [Clostridium botulinum]MCR1166709.1 hypothetical protein [Clostridium botulinum]